MSSSLDAAVTKLQAIIRKHLGRWIDEGWIVLVPEGWRHITVHNFEAKILDGQPISVSALEHGHTEPIDLSEATQILQAELPQRLNVRIGGFDKEARNRWVEHLEVRDLCPRQKADLVADLARLF